jgi:hypothetical protein
MAHSLTSGLRTLSTPQRLRPRGSQTKMSVRNAYVA